MPTAAPPSEPWKLAQHPSPDEIDWGLVEQLFHDQELVDLNGVAAMCGMRNRHSAYLWQRAARNYLQGGTNDWPPTREQLRSQLPENTCPPNDLYFVHSAVLPPPDIPGGGRGRDRWRKGTIYRWAMRCRRLSWDGSPVEPTTGPRAGRGPATGRTRTQSSGAT